MGGREGASHQLAYGRVSRETSPSAQAQTTPSVVVDVRRHLLPHLPPLSRSTAPPAQRSPLHREARAIDASASASSRRQLHGRWVVGHQTPVGKRTGVSHQLAYDRVSRETSPSAQAPPTPSAVDDVRRHLFPHLPLLSHSTPPSAQRPPILRKARTAHASSSASSRRQLHGRWVVGHPSPVGTPHPQGGAA